MCFLSRGTQIAWDVCFPIRGARIAMDMCFLGRGTLITRDMFLLGSGTHFTRDRIFLRRGTLFTRDMCSPGRVGLQESIFLKGQICELFLPTYYNCNVSLLYIVHVNPCLVVPSLFCHAISWAKVGEDHTTCLSTESLNNNNKQQQQHLYFLH